MPQELERAAAVSPDVSALDAAVAEVLETMFFTEATGESCCHESWESTAGARVGFEGTHCGAVYLGVSTDAARSMAAGFLGLDDAELTGTQLNQVMLEFTNIVCGAAMSRLWPESSLSLAPPEPLDTRGVPEGGWHRCFALPDGMLAVTICLRGDGLRE